MTKKSLKIPESYFANFARAYSYPNPKEYKCEEREVGIVPEELDILSLYRSWDAGKVKERAQAVVWHADQKLNILALMEDSEVFTEAVGKNDFTWEKGDVLEFFFKQYGCENYFEVHLAPNGATLEYSIPKRRSKTVKFSHEYLCRNQLIDTAETGLIDNEYLCGWYAFFSISLATLGIEKATGKVGTFCVCRYNYNPSLWEGPEESSTAAFSEMIFHDSSSWDDLII